MVATKAELKAKQDKIVHFQAFESSYFQGKIYFEDDGTQNYCFSKSIDALKILLIAFMFQRGYLKDCTQSGDFTTLGSSLCVN